MAAIDDKRLRELLDRFSLRLKEHPFTRDGEPTHEEAELTKDIWAALFQEERKRILENTTKMVAEDRKADPKKVPDQTPYAMRLSHYFLRQKVR